MLIISGYTLLHSLSTIPIRLYWNYFYQVASRLHAVIFYSLLPVLIVLDLVTTVYIVSFSMFLMLFLFFSFHSITMQFLDFPLILLVDS